jgi:hypothetical protein
MLFRTAAKLPGNELTSHVNGDRRAEASSIARGTVGVDSAAYWSSR